MPQKKKLRISSFAIGESVGLGAVGKSVCGLGDGAGVGKEEMVGAGVGISLISQSGMKLQQNSPSGHSSLSPD